MGEGDLEHLTLGMERAFQKQWSEWGVKLVEENERPMTTKEDVERKRELTGELNSFMQLVDGYDIGDEYNKLVGGELGTEEERELLDRKVYILVIEDEEIVPIKIGCYLRLQGMYRGEDEGVGEAYMEGVGRAIEEMRWALHAIWRYFLEKKGDDDSDMLDGFDDSDMFDDNDRDFSDDILVD